MTDYIAAYRAYLSEEKRASANTLSSYIRDLTQFQSWLITNGTADLRKVKKETINEYLLHMNHSGKSPATVTRSTASIKSFYSYMVQSGAVKTNPAKAVTAMKVERKYPEILTNREVELFLEQPKCVDEKGFRDHAMLELLYATGIRVSELIGLNVGDINLSAGFIRCRRRERKGRGAPAGPGKAFSARPRPWLCAVFGTLRLVKKYRVYCTWDTVGKKAKKGEEHHAIEQRIRTERR